MKKPRKAAAAAPRVPAPEVLLAAAQGQAAAGRYREAITAYKDLLKVEDRPQWRLALADAYAGRARELAGKGMPKEALTAWENRAQLAPDIPPDADYFALLLRLGRVKDVVNHYRRGDQLAPATLASLRSHLAAHHLGGEPAVAAGLPADDAILVQAESAARALDAWCRGDEAVLHEALAGISYRSPYRDLAQVLKALQRVAEAPGETPGDIMALLAKVADDSGFAPLRRACALALGPPHTLPERLAGAGEATRRVALTLAGWGEERQALWEEARRLGDLGPQALLRLMHRHRAVLGEEWVRTQGLRLLVPGWPKSAGWITEGGGRRLSDGERLLVTAWRAEDNNQPEREIDAWSAYSRHLTQGPRPMAGSDEALRIALVLRRVDSNRGILAQAAAGDDAGWLQLNLVEAVELSLDYDPDDRDTYERLVRYYLRGEDLKSARRVLDLGLKRFPADVGLLTAAMEIALTADAFKKAARYAREVLALDPINTGVRERLIKAHLGHAGKQLRAGRLDLAHKELEQAAEWDTERGQGGRLRERRELLRGLLDQFEDANRGQTGRGETGLRAQVRALGGGMAAAFALAQACEAAGRPVAKLLKAAGLGKIPVPDQVDLGDFLGRLRAHLDEGAGLSSDLARLFEKPLSEAARWPLGEAELAAACETLSRARLDRARGAFAAAGLQRWPRAPIFELHAFEARQQQRPRYLDPAAVDRLQDAFDRAQESGDQRTAHRIGECLAACSPFGGLGGGPFADFGDDAEDFPGPLGIGSDDALRAIIEIMGIDGILKTAGIGAKERAEFKRIERQFGREHLIETLIEMMHLNPPDFPGGLMPDLGPTPRRFPVPVGRTPSDPPKPGRTKGKARGRQQAPGNPDDDPEQLDLF